MVVPNTIENPSSGGGAGGSVVDATGATTDSFVSVFTQTSAEGLMGIGSIVNSGANDMDVRETAIDKFGNTVSLVTTVLAGDEYLLDLQANLDDGGGNLALPPFTSYQVEVASTVPGSPTDYELHFIDMTPGAGGGGGGTTPEAATFVVSPTPGVGDFTTIDAALAALPAEGGYILVREGTYAITSACAVPGKPVLIRGCGAATVVDLGSNAIAAFAKSGAAELTLENFSVQGDGTVGQELVTLSAGRVTMRDLTSDGVEIIIDSSAGPGEIYAENCVHTLPSQATAFYYSDGSSGNSSLTLVGVQAVDNIGGFGGMTGPALVRAWGCEFTVGSGLDLSADNTSWHGCDLRSDITVPVSAPLKGARFVDCRLGPGIEWNFSSVSSSPCVLEGSIVYRYNTTDPPVLVGSGATSTRIVGNVFFPNTAQLVALSIAASGCTIEGNVKCKVTETGAADGNIYGDNTGFDGSTIIGPSSVVNGALRTDDATNTGDAYATIVDHKNQKGLVGIGTVLNTDGANSLTVKETVTDAFGNTVSFETVVLASNDYMLDPQTNFDDGITFCFPPYLEYKVEVKSTTPGSPATYELHHMSQGAV